MNNLDQYRGNQHISFRSKKLLACSVWGNFFNLFNWERKSRQISLLRIMMGVEEVYYTIFSHALPILLLVVVNIFNLSKSIITNYVSLKKVGGKSQCARLSMQCGGGDNDDSWHWFSCGAPYERFHTQYTLNCFPLCAVRRFG